MAYLHAIRLVSDFQATPLPKIKKGGVWVKCLAGYVLTGTGWKKITAGKVLTLNGWKTQKEA